MTILLWLLIAAFFAMGALIVLLIGQAVVLTFAYAIRVKWVAWRARRADHKRRGAREKVWSIMVAAVALVALTGCGTIRRRQAANAYVACVHAALHDPHLTLHEQAEQAQLCGYAYRQRIGDL